MFALDAESLLEFFFKLLNLVALLGLFVYIFKNYILEGLRNHVIKEKQAEEGTQTKILILEEKGKELVHASFTQEQYCHYLLDKADLWRRTAALTVEKQQQEMNARHVATVVRLQKQAETVQAERLMEVVLPQALQEARAQLSKTYKDEKRGNAYMQNLLTLMKKSL